MKSVSQVEFKNKSNKLMNIFPEIFLDAKTYNESVSESLHIYLKEYYDYCTIFIP